MKNVSMPSSNPKNDGRPTPSPKRAAPFRAGEPYAPCSMARAQKDVIKAQLIAQMAAVYALALDFLGRTKRAEDIECGKTANRLVRTYTMQGDVGAAECDGGEDESLGLVLVRRLPDRKRLSSGHEAPTEPG